MRKSFMGYPPIFPTYTTPLRGVPQPPQAMPLQSPADAAGLPLEAAAMDLFNTESTTHVGIITALFYMRIQHRNDGVHMIEGWFEDEDGERYIDWREAWLETLTQAVMKVQS